MKKWNMSAYYTAILIGIVFFVLIGGCVTDTPASPSTVMPAATPTLPPMHPPLSTITMTPAQPTSPVVSSPDSTQDPGSLCNPLYSDSRIAVPVNISVAIRDPMPGIRYSLNESDSGRTIVLENGEVVEINLRWIPGLGFHWIIPVSGCGLELVNAGTYSDGGDFWNNTGHYRVRYRAVSSGTSVIDGKFILIHKEEGDLGFNLTVIVK